MELIRRKAIALHFRRFRFRNLIEHIKPKPSVEIDIKSSGILYFFGGGDLLK